MQMSLNTKQCASCFGGRLIRLELTPTISMFITSSAEYLQAVRCHDICLQDDISGSSQQGGPPSVLASSGPPAQQLQI